MKLRVLLGILAFLVLGACSTQSDTPPTPAPSSFRLGQPVILASADVQIDRVKVGSCGEDQ